MFFNLLDWQRAGLEPWLEMARQAGRLPLWQRTMAAQIEVMARNLAALDIDDLGLEGALARDVGSASSAEAVLEAAFWRLVRFRARESQPRILLVTPYSGYATAVLSRLVANLVDVGEVHVTDWRDAREVPPTAGRFGIDDEIEAVAQALLAIPESAHIVALSQAGPPALAAAARIAETAPQRTPLSITLMGAPIAPGHAPTPLQRLLAATPRAMIESQFLRDVSPPHAGAGRRVYPGIMQLVAVALAQPSAYLGIQAGLWLELLDGAPGACARAHGDLHRLIDVPAELYLDMLDHLLVHSLFDEDGPGVDGRLDRLQPVPLLTLEAAGDGLIGRGQTHAAHALLGHNRPDSDRAVDIAGAEHADLLQGGIFEAEVVPRLKSFLKAPAARLPA